ncbi:hypothetical protein IEO70_13090 [Bacillus sp. AGMB 02131]|uniref:DUF4901 domain-containing protein n=1 Tax=Peribacillus faecalis TaxID=2772559 RepID=A0A927HC77_9BACI|nr:hypothetical protein [Peribacillus faecalis]MBD3109281.1 hypothetical protein [Peribacillus faecalis]
MDKRIKELVDFTREKYGLYNYVLHTFSIHRNITIFKETVYSLNMEWFPNSAKDWDNEEENPDGSAYIELDMQTRKVKSIVFGGGISFVNSLKFDVDNKNEIIKWIERETDLRYGEQFLLRKEEDREFQFNDCIDGVKVSPSGSIDFRLDEEGRLTFFSVYGHFPSKELIKQETFKLSLDQLQELAKEQLKLVEFPSEEQKQLVPAFAIEEIYVRNDGLSTLPYQFIVDERTCLHLDQGMEWDCRAEEPFHGTIISLIEDDVSLEQALRCEPHPDLQPITEEDIQQCIISIQKFLSQEYSDDSGKWVVSTLYRDKGYLHATLKTKGQNQRVFNRKIKLFIDQNTYEVLNYMDNDFLINEMYKDLQQAEEVKVTKEEAFEKLKDFVTLTPYYVYDFEEDLYYLCGKLDCPQAVKASNGEVVLLDDL